MKRIEVLFSPAEFEALTQQRLKHATCLVFDILRATSSIVTALANGAEAVIPVQTIPEAVEAKRRMSPVLLAGERDGLRITSRLTGDIDFDLGNSPREFTREAVDGKTIIITTTNGTRALRACSGAERIVVGSFLNPGATLAYLRAVPVNDLIIVCSGTYEEAALEDTLAAGAIVEGLQDRADDLADSAFIAESVYRRCGGDLELAMSHARNGKRLLSIKELMPDVAYCVQRNIFSVLPCMQPNGRVTCLPSESMK
jgi:2-phosphosulfolactate phosphatase